MHVSCFYTNLAVPDEIFTVDSNAPSSIDSYSPTEGEEFSLSEPASVEVIDLSVSPRLEEVETTVAPTDALFEEQEAVATTLAPPSPASLLPPVAEGELVEQEVDTATPTAAPVLFTYAPEGRFVKLTKRLSKLKHKKLYHKLLIQRFFSELKPGLSPF